MLIGFLGLAYISVPLLLTRLQLLGARLLPNVSGFVILHPLLGLPEESFFF